MNTDIPTPSEVDLLEPILISDWIKFHHSRQRPLWHLVLMSLGITPSQEAVKELKKICPNLYRLYVEMKNELSLSLNQEGLEGHILYLPNYPKGTSRITRANYIIDMVSGIDVIEKRYKKNICSEFKSLKTVLSKIQLNRDASPKSLLILNAPIKEAKDQGKFNADRIAKGNEKKQNDRLDLFIYFLTHSKYGYKGNASTKEKAEIIQHIVEDMKAMGFQQFGLGKDSLKNILDRAFNTAKNSDNPLP